MSRSILIADRDVDIRNMGISIVWNSTAASFNMKAPTECINAKNYKNLQELYKGLGELDSIETVFLTCNLKKEEYELFYKLHNVKQLYIYTATNIFNMNFIKGMIHLKYLFINDSNISDVTPLVELVKIQEQQRVLMEHWKDRWNLQLESIAITNAKINDLSPFEKISTYFSDFNLSGNQIQDLSPLKNIRIYYLGMARNQIKSIEEYMNTHTSYLVDFRNNQIQSLEFMLERSYNIQRFFIKNNPCNSLILQNYHFIATDIDWEEEIEEEWEEGNI